MYGCLLELRLVQELSLGDLGDLVSYGLPQELRLVQGYGQPGKLPVISQVLRDLTMYGCLLELRLVQELRSEI